MTSDPAASLNHWIGVMRRARLGPTVKVVALMLASYANADGTHIYPGTARLAVESELSHRTVKRAMRTLREAGLIELTRRGARRRGEANEYRLIVGRHPLRPYRVLTEEQQYEAVCEVARAESRTSRHPRAEVSTGHPEPIEESFTGYRGPVKDVSTGYQGPVEPGSTGQTESFVRDTGDTPPSRETPSISLSRRAQSLAARLPGATGEEREAIVRMIESQKPRNYLAYLRSIPTSDLLHMLDEVRRQRVAAAPPGPGKPHWCGDCDPDTRLLGRDGDTPARCPRCHPLQLDGLHESRTRRPPAADGPSPEVQEQLDQLRTRFPRTL